LKMAPENRLIHNTHDWRIVKGQSVSEEVWLLWYKAQLDELERSHIREPRIRTPIPYQEIREAYVSVIQKHLESFPWQWWVSLTTRKHMPLEVIKGRLFWWLKQLRKTYKHKTEHIWFIEKQKREALHAHVVVYGVSDDRNLWNKAVARWEHQHSRGRYKYGTAHIKPFDDARAGAACNYLSKERVKSQSSLDGSGSFFEIFGYSRGVRKFMERSQAKEVVQKQPQAMLSKVVLKPSY